MGSDKLLAYRRIRLHCPTELLEATVLIVVQVVYLIGSFVGRCEHADPRCWRPEVSDGLLPRAVEWCVGVLQEDALHLCVCVTLYVPFEVA
jgi:hypothetical protein